MVFILMKDKRKINLQFSKDISIMVENFLENHAKSPALIGVATRSFNLYLDTLKDEEANDYKPIFQ